MQPRSRNLGIARASLEFIASKMKAANPNIPDDAELVDIHFDRASRMILLTFHSDTMPYVPEGCNIPWIAVASLL